MWRSSTCATTKRSPKDERTAKDDDALVSLQLENEMLQRGCEVFAHRAGQKLDASKYVVEDGKVRLPFTAIRGLGDAAAAALEQATMHGQEYISVEELQQASGVAQSVFDKLRAVGAFGQSARNEPGGFVQYDIKVRGSAAFAVAANLPLDNLPDLRYNSSH